MYQWYVIGDSHVEAINYAIQKGWIAAQAKSHIVPGATAVGLRNPNAATNAVNIFKDCLSPMLKNTIPVIQLGEVDCGFVMWWRAKKHNEPVETQLDESINAYFEFVDFLLGIGYKSIVITGAILPTILDGQDFGEVANKRKEVTAPLKFRTLLTLQYNKMLKEGATSRSLPYIDITKEIMDIDTGMISNEFRNADPCDHHLDPHKGGRLWANALNSLPLVEINPGMRTTLEKNRKKILQLSTQC